MSPPTAAPARNLVREAGGLAGARLGVRVLGIAVGWVVARVIGPEGLGQLSLPNLMLAVAPFLTLGFADGLVRELPLAEGQAPEQRRSLLAASWAAGLLTGLAVLLVAAGYQAVAGESIRDSRLYWLAVLAGLAHMAFKVSLSSLTGSRRIKELALLQVLQGLLRAGLVLILLFTMPASAQVYALHTGVALSLTGSLVWAARHGAVSRPHFDARALGRLGRSGPPLALASLLLMLLIVGDRLVLSRVLEPQALGIFEQGVLIRDGLLLLPAVLLTLLIPDYSARQGDPARRPGLLTDVARQSGLVAVGTPLLLGLTLLQLPWLFALLLPRFTPGMPVLQLAVLGMCPIFLSYILVSLLMSEGRAVHVGLLALVCLGLLLGLDLRPLAVWQPWLERVLAHGPPVAGLERALAGALTALGAFWLFSLGILLGNARRLGLGAKLVLGWIAPSLLLSLAALAGLEQGWLQGWNPWVNLGFALAGGLFLATYERRSGQLGKLWRARRAVKS
ncbi:MAG: oligosaccharide flippase family protein [Candidatus Delongbacteria bacterium]